jgi:signal transduction histidine kinase/ActR/RegA family two-component response regulator
MNWLTLAFPHELEREFRESQLPSCLRQMRTATLLGMLLYGLFGFLDAWVAPAAKTAFWFIRFAVVLPFNLSMMALTFTPLGRRHPQLLTAAAVLVPGLGIVAMIGLAPGDAGQIYYAGLILVAIFGYTFTRLRFINASIVGWGLVLAYEAAMQLFVAPPFYVLLSNNFFFLGANLILMFGCYSIEFYRRRSFLQTRALENEKEKVEAVNRELEARVAERTAELTAINADLVREIAERKQAEAERRALEAELRKSQKMEAVGALAGGVAHDLNNILSGIVSYPELILLELPEESPLRKPIATIQEAGQRAADIVQDLLTLARRGVAAMEPVDLNAIVRRYLQSPEFLNLKACHRAVRVEGFLEPELLPVTGSPVHLGKSLMNLVTNAAEAMPEGGLVRIVSENRLLSRPVHGFETVPAGEYVVLTVSDTGSGIAPENLERIFEPFFSTKKMGRSGTGLGMAVVWGTIRDHGGHIDIHTAPGRGTTFTLYFPAARGGLAEAPAPKRAVEDYRGHGESVLVVDDVREQREIAAAMLRRLGYQVRVAASGEEAVGLVRERPVDVLLLDMVMDPGIDGLDTYRRIREIRPGQKAVIASGYAETDRVKSARELGAGAYVRKPYTLEKIGLALRTEIAGRRADPHPEAVSFPAVS